MRVVSRGVSVTGMSFLRSFELKTTVLSALRGVETKGKRTHSMPTIPSTTRFSPVIVPVLSKQQISTRPAKGMRNGSVQKIAAKRTLKSVRSSPQRWKREKVDVQYLLRATRLAFTAMVSSMGSSGGTTEVIMMTQSRRSLERLRSCSSPARPQRASVSRFVNEAGEEETHPWSRRKHSRQSQRREGKR